MKLDVERLKELKARLLESPSAGYTRRVAAIETADECDAGGQPVVRFELDVVALNALINLLQPDAATTFGSKLRAMRKDLASIVDRMNRDKSINVAMLAQKALVAVDELEDEMESLGTDEFDWTWQPEEEPEDA